MLRTAHPRSQMLVNLSYIKVTGKFSISLILAFAYISLLVRGGEAAQWGLD